MELREIIESFAELSILVAGDPMADVYHFGHVDRLSPEAPVPVFLEDSVSRRPGGAANVVQQLRALGIRTGNTFPPCDIWSEKHRYLVGHQQLFRVDKDVNVAADWSSAGRPREWHALVISDYNKGAVLGPRLAEQIAAFNAAAVPIVVDPKGLDWAKYQGCDVITPNSSELHGHNYTVSKMGRIVHKAGPDGLYLHLCGVPESTRQHFPAQAQHVFDVTGAGDTVTALIAATLAAKGTLEQGCELANIAAGYVVGEVGTTTCPLAVLRDRLP
jgi:D-beta-D-heptose 7-phosphate kinase/D-beta-D-heptose 1-phosphate adenosyltransferase